MMRPFISDAHSTRMIRTVEAFLNCHASGVSLLRQRQQKAAAEIAMTESTNMDIQRFARQVAGELSEELTSLNALAKLKDFSPPPATEGALQVEATHRLHGLTGSALDHEFISLMTAEQEQCIRIFDNAQTAADPDIRKYATEVLPRLKKDYAKVVELQASLAPEKTR